MFEKEQHLTEQEPQLGQAELAAQQALFLRAAARAQLRAQARDAQARAAHSPPRRAVRRWRVALGAALLLLAALPLTYLWLGQLADQRSTPLVVQVTGQTGFPVSGAEMHIENSLRTGGLMFTSPLQSLLSRLVAVSDRLGIVRNLQLNRQRIVVVKASGEVLGRGRLEDLLSDHGAIELPTLQYRQLSLPVEIQPGQRQKINSELTISLDAKAKSAWQGKLILQLSWPAPFDCSRIAGGIYRLDGPPSADLTLIVSVPSEKLRLLRGQARELQVIAQNQRYAKEDIGPYGRGLFHQGWYNLAQPPAGFDYLQHGQPQISSRLKTARIAWQAQPQVQYALLLPVVQDGQAALVWQSHVDLSTGNPVASALKPMITLDGFTRPQYSFWDIVYDSGNGSEPYELNWLPLKGKVALSLTDGLWTRRAPNRKSPPLMQSQDNYQLPGKIFARQMNVTLCDPRDSRAIPLEMAKPEGHYSIVLTKDPDSNRINLAVTGTLNLLAQLPRWDIYSDYYTDADSNEITIELSSLRQTSISVTLTEKNHAVVRLDTFLVNDNLDYVRRCDQYASIDSRPSRPTQQANLSSSTLDYFMGVAPYTVFSGVTLGPLLYIELPAGAVGKPLASIKLHMRASSAGGPTNGIQIVPYIKPVKSDADNPQVLKDSYFVGSDELRSKHIPAKDFNVGFSNVSLDVPKILRAAKESTSLRKDISEYYQDNIPMIVAYKLLLNLDMAELPSDSEIIRRLQLFRGSELDFAKTVTTDNVALNWTVPMFGTTVPSGSALLVGANFETCGYPFEAMWNLQSGGSDPARVELVTVDGQTYTFYFDYRRLTGGPAAGAQ